jgi:hypothetical protein
VKFSAQLHKIAVPIAGFAGVVYTGGKRARGNFLPYLFTTLWVGIILLQLYNAALLSYAKFVTRSHDAPVSI